jgi:murein L,D-transpeptidase YafK
MNTRLLLSAILLFGLTLTKAVKASDTVPSLFLEMSEFFTHHAIVAEKSTHKLYVYKNNNGSPELVKEYQMATGKSAGNKVFTGDHRTPEGIYHFNEFIPNAQLLKRYGDKGKIYGVGAFTINYPNPVDHHAEKSGGGIWLHSTNDETRIEKGLDSRGCLVVANKDLIEISRYLELGKTPIIIVQNVSYYSQETFETLKEQVKETVSSWLTAWQTENKKEYFSKYHPQKFHDKYRGNYKQFKTYKTAVFSGPGAPEISIKHLSILSIDNYIVARFAQHYKSSKINDVGVKTLYLQQDEFYNWKIVEERWSKLTQPQEAEQYASFRPRKKFFESTEQALLDIEQQKERN